MENGQDLGTGRSEKKYKQPSHAYTMLNSLHDKRNVNENYTGYNFLPIRGQNSKSLMTNSLPEELKKKKKTATTLWKDSWKYWQNYVSI